MDWISLIADLKERGVTQQQLAAFCGCKQPMISYLSSTPGAQPRYEIGQSLKTLHGASTRELLRLLTVGTAKAA